jgi:hypothetical protein
MCQIIISTVVYFLFIQTRRKSKGDNIQVLQNTKIKLQPLS